MTTEQPNRWLETRSVSGDTYHATYERRAAAGENVHGEADFVERFTPASVLDGGGGTVRLGGIPPGHTHLDAIRRLA